eukprot:Rmarinus@m.21983
MAPRNSQKVDVKVVLLGNKNVGKTCLSNRYVSEVYTSDTKTSIGASFVLKPCVVDGKTVNLGIWDTAGEERFDSLANFYCRGARGAVVCFDLTDRASFENITKWIEKVVQEADERCIVTIVGTKLDIVEQSPDLRQVETGEAREFAQSQAASYFETSSRMGWNVDLVFEDLAQRFRQQKGMKAPASVGTTNWGAVLAADDSVDLGDLTGPPPKKKCCS